MQLCVGFFFFSFFVWIYSGILYFGKGVGVILGVCVCVCVPNWSCVSVSRQRTAAAFDPTTRISSPSVNDVRLCPVTRKHTFLIRGGALADTFNTHLKRLARNDAAQEADLQRFSPPASFYFHLLRTKYRISIVTLFVLDLRREICLHEGKNQ